MKTTITIAALLIGMIATAQIEITETTSSNQKLWSSFSRSQSLNLVTDQDDSIYVFTYKNFKYQYLTQFESFMFIGKEELLSFLDVCSEVINEGKKFDLQLSGESLRLQKEMKSVRILTSKGWTWFDAKNIDKIKEALDVKN